MEELILTLLYSLELKVLDQLLSQIHHSLKTMPRIFPEMIYQIDLKSTLMRNSIQFKIRLELYLSRELRMSALQEINLEITSICRRVRSISRIQHCFLIQHPFIKTMQVIKEVLFISKDHRQSFSL